MQQFNPPFTGRFQRVASGIDRQASAGAQMIVTPSRGRRI